MEGLYLDALYIAYQAHAGQFDKGGHPYILHPIRVSTFVKNYDEKICAVLHDVIEDTSVTLDDLADKFPKYIIEALNLLTHKKEDSYMDYIRKIKTNKLATIVKLADLEDNMDLSRLKGTTEKDFQRIKKYEKAKKILEEVD